VRSQDAVGGLVSPTICALITLTLDPDTSQSDDMRIKYHREEASEKNYNRDLLGFTFKKWQADQISSLKTSPEVEAFRADKDRTTNNYANAKGEVVEKTFS
jgi:hypothetical protein